MTLHNSTDGSKTSYMEPLEVLEVVLLDLRDLVVLQVEQGGVIGDVFGNFLQT